MNRWAKIVLGITVLGIVGWLWAGILGTRATASTEGFVSHTLAAFTAVIVLTFANVWSITYLTAFGRVAARAAGGDRPELRDFALRRRRWIVLAAAAVIVTVGQFAVSGLLFPRALPGRLHLIGALAALALQLALAVASVRLLTRQHRLVAKLDAEPARSAPGAGPC